MSGKLHHFSQSEIVIGQDDAWRILVFFFGGNAGTSPAEVNSQDIEFAQSLLFEAMAASYKMDEAFWNLLKGNLIGLPVYISVAVAVFLKGREMGLIRIKERTPQNPQIYSSIKNTITRNWRSIWSIRIHGGGLEW
jgi:hypothetical protein